MYKRILFPTDGSEGAEEAFEYVLDVAAAEGATVVVLNVADTSRDSLVRIEGEVVDTLESAGEEVVAEAAERARARNVPVETETLQGTPAETIVDYASENSIDLVTMPTHGRTGLRRLFLGSVTERVVRHADVPVLTVRPGAEMRHPYDSVLVPTDGSEAAERALDAAIEAAADGATLHVLSVVNTTGLGADVYSSTYTSEVSERAEQVVEEAVERAEAAGVEHVVGSVETGPAIHQEVLDYAAEHGVDLVAVGTHGRSGVDRYLLGSVTEKLVRTAPVPLLTVPGPSPEA